MRKKSQKLAADIAATFTAAATDYQLNRPAR